MIKTEHNNKAIVKFEGNEIRKLTVNDKDYFIAKDVFDALGENNYYYVLTNKINGHEITKFPKFTKRKSPLFVSSNGIREIANYYDTDKSYNLSSKLLGEDNHPKVKTENKVTELKQQTKNNNIKMFIFNGDQVRTVMIDGNPYFVGKDVAEILGYKNARDALYKHVDEEDKLGSRFATSGQNRQMTVINESGLYSLILSSKLSQAKQFKHWVTNEVLPSIRKTGSYSINQPKDSYMINDPVARAKRWIEEETEREQLADQNKVLLIEKEHNKKPLSYYNKILNNPVLMSITQIAKDYGITGHRMNTLLHDLGVQYKQSGIWLLYSQYQGLGWTQSTTYVANKGFPNETVTFLTKWTQKGRLALYKLLKENNTVPMIEKEVNNEI